MISFTTTQHIYCTNTVKIIAFANELYVQKLSSSCCYMFIWTTTQHIYCTNNVQTVQLANELYVE